MISCLSLFKVVDIFLIYYGYLMSFGLILLGISMKLGRISDTLVPSQWIPFVFTPEESVAFGCNFIMAKHMYRSALASEKELEQGFQPSFAFPLFEALVVIFLYRESSYRRRSESTVSKVELRKMLAIIKADQRRHRKGKEPFESPWEVFLYMYCESTWDFHWDEIESWVEQN